MAFVPELAAAAAARWAARAAERARTKPLIDAGHATEAESPDRVRLRLERLTAVAAKEQSARASIAAREAALGGRTTASILVDTVGFERVVGRADFLGTEFLELAIAVARFVGRISLLNAAGRNVGYGTGFMVSPQLLLTNHHVLPDAATAAASEVQFDYQNDRFRRPLPVVAYKLDPATFYLSDAHLDYAFVAVREQSVPGAGGPVALTRYGWNRLIPDQGKALLGDPLNIIQHPRGQPKQIVLRANQLVDLVDDTFAHYVADTEPGSSGSPVYNDQWEVVALHHQGVPKRDAAGRYVAKDGSVWSAGMDPNDLEWVANEGVRISKIVDHVRKRPLAPAQSRLRSDMLTLEPPHPLEAAAMGDAPRSDGGRDAGGGSGSRSEGDATHTFVLPLRVTVSVGLGQAGAEVSAAAAPVAMAVPTAQVAAAAGPEPAARPAALEKLVEPIVDRDYGSRRGYDADFLGPSAPIPEVTDDSVVARTADGAYVLPYEHFSVVMHAGRRLALFTAANVSGAPELRRPEPGDYSRRGLSGLGKNDQERWFTDPRIPREHQLPDRFFSRDGQAFDKGHVVRREDVCFGTSYAQVRRANGDTFHTTNCSPQVAGFNRAPGDWGSLENHVLRQLAAHGDRYSLFAGPVLADDDRWFDGVDDVGPVRVQIPRRYWKLVVSASGAELRAFAFVLEQDLAEVPLADERFDPGAEWADYLIGVPDLEALLGVVRFPEAVHQADRSAGSEGDEAVRVTGAARWAERSSAARAARRAGAHVQERFGGGPALERYPESETRAYAPDEVAVQVKWNIAYLTRGRWPAEAIGTETSFDAEIGWDRIAMTDFRHLSERVFGVTLSAEGVLAAEVVGDAVALAGQALDAAGRTTA